MMMPSSVKRPARPRELNLRRTSSCSSLINDQYMPSSSACGDEKPAIITEDFEAEELEEREKEVERGKGRVGGRRAQEPVATMQLLNLKQKSRSFHMPPSINVSSCEDPDLSQVRDAHMKTSNLKEIQFRLL